MVVVFILNCYKVIVFYKKKNYERAKWLTFNDLCFLLVILTRMSTIGTTM